MTDMLTNRDSPGGEHQPGDGNSNVADGQVRASLAPLPTVVSLLMEALGVRRGSPAAWYGPVRTALEPEDLALLRPLLRGGVTLFIPDCLVPEPEGFTAGFGEQLEQVASASVDDLLVDLAAHDLLDTAWAATARAPRRWLSAYAACLGRAWTGTSALWHRARPLLESEVDRVGSALARGTLDLLLQDVSPRAHLVDGRWFLDRNPGPLTSAPRMVLSPMICGPRGLLVADGDDIVHGLAYPVPGARQLSDRRINAADEDSLHALIGEPRAELLRRLDRAVSAGSLAESMLYAPSAITHHLLSLERAGLVHRERNGRHVLVHRTPRGTALLNLYES
jgi:DNA-binding transcriptional ArsR family regulator